MKELSEVQLQENWNILISFIENTFSEDRKDNLLKLYHDFEERIIFAPASGREHFHSAYIGGYIVHVLNVIKFSKKVFDLWVECGYQPNFSLEELLFCALNHDLGKIGDLKNDYYIPNKSQWHKENQGLIYEFNKELTFMNIPHRSLFLLQHYNIKFNQQEMITILLHDGLYDDGNKEYLITYKPENQLRTKMPIILHQADMMASSIEYDQWLHQSKVDVKKEKEKKILIKKQNSSTFDELFTT